MGIIDRILQVPNYYNLTINEFSKVVGVSNGYFAKQKANNANVGSRILEKIVRSYPEIDTLWLLTGEGEIFKTKSTEILIKGNDKANDKDFDKERKLQKSLSIGEGEIFKTKSTENVTLENGNKKSNKKGNKQKLQKTLPFAPPDFKTRNKPQPVIYEMPPSVVAMLNDPDCAYDADNSVSVPVVHIEAAAGGGAANIDFDEAVETMILPKSFLASTRCLHYCIEVRGESMEPTLLDKTRIVVRLLDRSDWANLHTGDVYVITDREGLTYVKRIHNRLRERGKLVLLSDNPDRDRYRSFNLAEDEIQNIWAVELYIADHMPPAAQRFDSMRSELDALRDRLDEMELRMR